MSTPTNRGNPGDSPPGNRGASPDDAQPVPIPDHELLRCIGKGSYGRVWLARNSMGQYRAVKIVYRANFQDDVPYLRELSGIRQFEPISRSHEGFVDVLQVGINEPGGYFYYVMELGDDQTSGQTIQPAIYAAKTLRDVLPAGKPLPLAECLRLGLALSLALAELHRHKLVHRDIKPSNIIFVNGVPKLADIGLVTTVGDNLSFVGTEGYVPPEGPGKPQADVYALGKVLYEASTGNDRLAFPELPTAYDAETEVERLLELNEVTLQACARDPFNRYQTAWEMHAHLLVLANGKSVKRLLSLERNLGRLKKLAIFAGALTFVLAAVLYPIYNEIRRRGEERQRHVGANVAYGNAAMAAGDNPGALTYFTEALRTDERDGKRAELDRLRVGAVLEQCPKLIEFWQERGPVDQLAISPDGTRLLALPEGEDATCHSLSAGIQVGPEFAAQGFCPAGAFSPDGELAATTVGKKFGTNAVTIWEVKTRRVRALLPYSLNTVHSVRFSPDSRRVVISCDSNNASVWNLAQKRTEFVLDHAGPVLFSDFSHDGKLIVTASQDGTARVWDAHNGTNLLILPGISWITHAAFSPDDQLLVTCGFDKKAWVWNATNGIRLSSGLSHEEGINWAEFSPDGRMIVTGSWDRTVRLWSAHTFEPWELVPVLNHNSAVFCAVFSPDGHGLFTSCWDGTVRHWDLAGGRLAARPLARIQAPDALRYLILTNQTIQVFDAIADQPVSQWRAVGIQNAKFNRSGDFVLGTCLDEGIRSEQRTNLQVWEVKSGQAIGSGIRPTEPVLRAEVSDDGRLLATVAHDHVRLWEVASGREMLDLPHSTDTAITTFSFDGSKLITADQNEVRIWETGTGRAVCPPLIQNVAGVMVLTAFATFSRDDRRVITCCYDEAATKCYAQMWDVATGAPVGPRMFHDDGVIFSDLSSDGTRVVTAGEDRVAKIWDLRDFKVLGRALKHRDQVKTAIFDAPARMVLTAGNDYSARLWAADSGDPLTPPLRHIHRIVRASFVPGTKKIVTIGAAGGETTVWTLPEENRPVVDLMDLARLLSGDAIAPEGLEMNTVRTNSLAEVWQRLRSAYPEQFRVTPEAVEEWDRMVIAQARKEADAAAVTFHVWHLHQSRPDDPMVFDNLDLPVLEGLRAKGPDDPMIAAAVQRARRAAEIKAAEAAKAAPASSAP